MSERDTSRSPGAFLHAPGSTSLSSPSSDPSGAVPKALNGVQAAGADTQALADLEARLAAEEARTAALTAALKEAKRDAEVPPIFVPQFCAMNDEPSKWI